MAVIARLQPTNIQLTALHYSPLNCLRTADKLFAIPVYQRAETDSAARYVSHAATPADVLDFQQVAS